MTKKNGLDTLKTLAVGQAADLKVDTGELRIWVNRVTGETEYERLVDGKWVCVPSPESDEPQ